MNNVAIELNDYSAPELGQCQPTLLDTIIFERNMSLFPKVLIYIYILKLRCDTKCVSLFLETLMHLVLENCSPVL